MSVGRAAWADGVSTFADVGGRALHVRRDGRGNADPPLLFLHALGTDLRVWDAVVGALGGGTLLRYDLGGHGLSETVPGDRSMADLAGELDALLDAAGLERVVLVGVSVGGQVALRQALARPGRVAGMVLCDTAARIGQRERWQARIDEVRDRGLEAVAPDVVARWFTPAFAEREPARVRGYRTLLARTDPEAYAGVCAALRDADLRPHLGEIHVPALVVCGDQDEPTPPAQARELAAGLPHARYLEIEDAAHLPPVERPAPLAHAIATFLQEELRA